MKTLLEKDVNINKQTNVITSWRVSEASETLSEVYKVELVRYIYYVVYICIWMYVCHKCI